jgi:hypothetical protein
MVLSKKKKQLEGGMNGMKQSKDNGKKWEYKNTYFVL